MKRLYDIVVKGNENVWAVPTIQDEKYHPEYTKDKLPIMRYPFTTWWDDLKARFFPNGRLYSIEIDGESGATYSFLTHLTAGALKVMSEDGVNCFNEVANIVPEWVVDRKLVRPWCFIQDLFNFRWKELFLPKDKLL